jgi:tetratricopeptide (TPR) repeat protein
VSVASLTPAPVAAAPIRRRASLRVVLGILAFVAATYVLAWLSAYNLTRTFLADADTSFEAGEYLRALSGYEEYDEAQRKNVFHGGYAHVVNIWRGTYSFPIPSEVERARERIDEIVNERLTIDDAERFIQRNIGRENPYMARIYLRLGELYEEDGDTRTARDVYEEVIEFFPRETDIVERAQMRLDALE